MISTAIELNSRCYPCRAILFDLDGTLVDTSKDLWFALQIALDNHGLASITSDEFYATLHYGMAASVEMILKEKNADPLLIKHVVHDYKEHYLRLNHQHAILYRGVKHFLDQCQSLGLKLGICTNKESRPTMDLLRSLSIDHYFDVVLGLDQVAQPKPSPDPLLQAFENMNQPKHLGVFIGDSFLDLAASRAANIPFLLHGDGFGATEVGLGLVDGCFHSYMDLIIRTGDR